MKTGKTSRSAEGVTLARALESQRPPEARVCYDPLAVHLLQGKTKMLYKMILNPWLRRILSTINPDPVPVAILGYVPLRTRFIDDQLQACIRDGLEQLVILGAGFDSRAYRFDELKNGVKVYEVDHPSTQKTKLSRIQRLMGSVPEHVTHVPMDFQEHDLYDELRKCGYDSNMTTMFIWEGVSYYLEPKAVDQTLEFVTKRSKPGSSIVFDYLPMDVVNRQSALPMAAAYLDYMVNMGEPVRFGIEPERLDDFLTERGFTSVKALTVDQCRRMYHTKYHGDTLVLNIFSLVQASVLP